MGFLTIIPAGAARPDALRRAVLWFPVVGLGLGIAVALLDALLTTHLAPELAAPLDLAALALLTGGLHLDGLADTADGLFAGGTRERRLALMREPAVGAFGVAAVALVLLTETAALAREPDRGIALVAAATTSRAAMACALAILPYARESGIGTAFGAGTLRARALPGALAIAAVAALLGPAVLLAPLGAAILAVTCVRTLGGATGDVYGAIGELTFALTLVALTSA